MELRRKGGYLTFCDGCAAVYGTTGRRYRAAEPRIPELHYHEQTVGERRYWDAYVSGVEIEMAAAVPAWADIRPGDLFVTGGRQYVVAQVQHQDTRPQSKLLSLQSAQVEYREAE